MSIFLVPAKGRKKKEKQKSMFVFNIENIIEGMVCMFFFVLHTF